MIWSPDSRIAAKQPYLPMLRWSTVVAGPCGSGAETGARVPMAPSSCPAPRLQWRDRVGFAPTSHDHRVASDVT